MFHPCIHRQQEGTAKVECIESWWKLLQYRSFPMLPIFLVKLLKRENKLFPRLCNSIPHQILASATCCISSNRAASCLGPQKVYLVHAEGRNYIYIYITRWFVQSWLYRSILTAHTGIVLCHLTSSSTFSQDACDAQTYPRWSNHTFLSWKALHLSKFANTQAVDSMFSLLQSIYTSSWCRVE